MITILLIFHVILALIIPDKVLANELFKDDFSNVDFTENNWEFINIQNSDRLSWKIVNEKLVGQVSLRQGSLYLHNKNYDLENYTYSFNVKNLGGVDQWILFRISEDKEDYYLFDIRYLDQYWSHDCNNFRLYRHGSTGYKLLKEVNRGNFTNFFDITQNEWRDVDIVLNENNIKVFFDNVLVMDFYDEYDDFLERGSFGFGNWAGEYWRYDVVNYFDDVVIKDLEVILSTPKIVIIPGLGASWNTLAMVSNLQVDDDQWKITPFVHNYDGLINTLKENGLEEGEDFFVWNYDWRKPVSEISEKLGDFLDEKLASDEFYLVGHSLGGLVARDWLQNNESDLRLKKIYTLGTPHYGVTKAYEAWSGGKVSDNYDFGTIVMNVLVQLQKKNFATTAEVLRNYVPVIKDLLPNYVFLKKDGIIFDNSIYKNDYLIQNNPQIPGVFNKISEYFGKGIETKEWINLKESTVYEKTLSVWLEGKPDNYEYGSGDGTVLKKSAMFVGDDDGENREYETNHGQIVDKSLGDLIQIFGLEANEVGIEDYNWNEKLVYYIGSPAYLEANCDDGQVGRSDEMGFLILDSKSFGECEMSIVGTGIGDYHVAYGKVGEEENWKYFEGSIVDEETKLFEVGLDDGQMINSSENLALVKDLISKHLGTLMKKYPNNVNLPRALKEVKRDNVNEMLAYLFKFRAGVSETQSSQLILDNAIVWLERNHQKTTFPRAKVGYNMSKRMIGFVDLWGKFMGRRNNNPSQFGSINYLTMNNYLELQKKYLDEKKYGRSMAYGWALQLLAKQVW